MTTWTDHHLLDRCTWPNSFAWFFGDARVDNCWLGFRSSTPHNACSANRNTHTHTHIVETHTHPAQKVLHTFMGFVFGRLCLCVRVCVSVCVCVGEKEEKQNRCTLHEQHVLRQSRRRRRQTTTQSFRYVYNSFRRNTPR